MKLPQSTHTTKALYKAACQLLEKIPRNESYRLVGISTYHLESGKIPAQGDLFTTKEKEKAETLDEAFDSIRQRFGDDALCRAQLQKK